MEEDKLTDEEHREVKALIDRTNKSKPKKEDIQALRDMLAKHPRLWRAGGDLAVQNQYKLLNDTAHVHFSKAARELVDAGLRAMRRQLGHAESSMLEQMLIEQVLLSWLRLNIWEYQFTGMSNGEGITLTVAEFWEKRMSAAQRRFLRACETLARVRRLARNTPALQLNINTDTGQQVNIAGDFVKSSDAA